MELQSTLGTKKRRCNGYLDFYELFSPDGRI
jgi:hypothetical protein